MNDMTTTEPSSTTSQPDDPAGIEPDRSDDPAGREPDHTNDPDRVTDLGPTEGAEPGHSADAAAPESPALSGVRLLEREGDLAADYLENLLDIADLDGDIDIDVEGERATVDIVGSGLKALVGPAGETLDALQELTRLAVQRETGVRSRLMLDIGGFRAGRRVELHQVGLATAEDVRRTGAPKALPPMTPFERKVVHDAVAEVDGLVSESEGEGPGRFVVVRPA